MDASTTGPDESWAAAASSALYSSVEAASRTAVLSASGTITSAAAGIPTSTSTSIPTNPLLELQPSYARSLVVQIIVLACVATLHVVLLLHLLFTTRYHLPLAKTNYILLTSGCITSFAAILWQVVQVAYDARDRARQWPFMYDYLEYVYPDTDWALGRQVVWLILNAIVVLLCHAAHIHVLTLLYPSALETRLLLALLLPLALISCALSFSALLTSQREQDIFDAGSAICNSTLTLLYTCALLFWGLYIARPRAWGKTDDSGSTAVFGGCAIGMAILGTALSFFGVQRGAEAFAGNEGWLSKVTWCVLLWQTWFSVWWWIGAGMYGAERPLDEDEELDERYSSSHTIFGHEGSIRRFMDENIPGLRRRRKQRRQGGPQEGNASADGEAIEMRGLGEGREITNTQPDDPFPRVDTSTGSQSSTTNTSTPPTLLSTLMRRFRKAHTRALRQAQRDLKKSAEGNAGLNEVIHGKRGNGWSVSGILKARQQAAVGNRAASSRTPGAREDLSTRDDRRVGATRLDEPWEDLAGGEVQPVTTKRFQNWRRKDVTRYD